MHFSRLIRIGCVSGLAASPILAQSLPVSVEHAKVELHESIGDTGAPLSVREQLTARIKMLRTEGQLTDKQAEHLRQEVENQIAQAEKSRDSLRIVSVAGQLESRIDATAGAALALQTEAQSESATRKGLDAIRQYEAKVAIARSRREARLTAEAVIAEGARRERQAQKMQQFAAIQSARLDALTPKPVSSPVISDKSIIPDAGAQIATVHSKAIEVLHAEPVEPPTISAPAATEKVAVKESSETSTEQPKVATVSPSAEQIEKLQAAALEVLHAQQAEAKKTSRILVAQNNAESTAAKPAAVQEHSAPAAASAEQVEKLQAAALEVLHSQPSPVEASPAKKPAERKSNKTHTAAETAVSSKFAKPAEAPVDAHERAAKELREKMQKPVTNPALSDTQIALGQQRAIEALHQSSPVAASSAPAVESDQELQKRARDIVRQQKAEAEQARLAAKNAEAADAPKTETAPRITAQVDPSILERARAILREHQASETTNTTTATPSVQPTVQSQSALPKLKSDLKGSGAEPAASSAAPASDSTVRSSLPPASDEALERARALLRQQKPTTAVPATMPTPTVPALSSSVPAESPGSGLSEKTRQLLIRQNKELEKSAGKTATPAPANDSGKIDPYARAREVLRNQPNSTKDAPVSPSIAAPSASAPASPAIVATPVPPPSAPEQVAPAALPSTVVVAPQTQPASDRNDAVLERAREILRQQKASSQTVSATSTPATATSAPASPVSAQPVAAPRTDTPAAVDTAVVHARALEALHAQENAEKKSAPPVAAKSTPAVQKPAPSSEKPATAVKPETVMKPAPTVQPSPVVQTAPAAKTKKEKLADLLELYKADKITPSQYQEERAKIIAEP